MSLFSIYMNDLIRTMQTDKESVFNQARLRFLGRHILAFLRLRHLYSRRPLVAGAASEYDYSGRAFQEQHASPRQRLS